MQYPCADVVRRSRPYQYTNVDANCFQQEHNKGDVRAGRAQPANILIDRIHAAASRPNHCSPEIVTPGLLQSTLCLNVSFALTYLHATCDGAEVPR